MSFRTTLVLLGLCVAVSVAVHLDLQGTVFHGWREIDAPFDVTLESITGIEVQRADGTRIVCERVGTDWVMREPLAFPASVAAAQDGVADGLRKLRTRGEGSDDLARHGLDAPELRAAFVTSRGREEIAFGKDHPTLPLVYALVRGKAFLVDQAVRDRIRGATVDVLRDDAISDINSFRATRVVVEGSGNRVELKRVQDGWEVSGDLPTAADVGEVRQLVDVVNSWAIEEYVADGIDGTAAGQPYGLDPPRFRLEIEAESPARRRTILVGGDAPSDADPMVFVSWGDGRHVFRASAQPLVLFERPADTYREHHIFQFVEPELERVVVARDPGGADGERVEVEPVSVGDGMPMRWEMTVTGTGEKWPVDASWIRGFTEALRSAQLQGFLPRAEPRQYGLDQPFLVVELTPRGGSAQRLFVGKKETADGSARYVLSPEWQFVGVTTLPLEAELEGIPWSFRSERPHDIPASALKNIKIRRPGHPELWLQRPFQIWRLAEDSERDLQEHAAALDTIAAGLAGMRAFRWSEPGPDAPGPDDHALRIELLDEAESYVYWVGRPDRGGGRWVREGGREWCFATRPVGTDLFRLIEATFDALAGG